MVILYLEMYETTSLRRQLLIHYGQFEKSVSLYRDIGKIERQYFFTVFYMTINQDNDT